MRRVWRALLPVSCLKRNGIVGARLGDVSARPRNSFGKIAFVVIGALLLSTSASAVVIKSGDGSGNTTAPTNDPGFGHVGSRGSLTGVYLGNGWVITAAHVGSGPFVVNSVVYQSIPGSNRRPTDPVAGLADLVLFKIDGDPGLPSLTISATTPSLNTPLTLIGNGFDRGAATTWSGIDGWVWGGAHTIRWGTNKLNGSGTVPDGVGGQTVSFHTDFDENAGGGGTDESQGSNGDSGGGVFYENGTSWELAGIMFSIASFVDQPANTTLFGNLTYMADLATYRNDIVAITTEAACNDGVDDDQDGLTDYPADPGCSSAADTDEQDAGLVCDNGLDDDGDGLIDWPLDLGCASSTDSSEQSANLRCDDGLDNDGDGFTDFPADGDCLSQDHPSEASTPPIPVTSALGAGALMGLLTLSGRRTLGS